MKTYINSFLATALYRYGARAVKRWSFCHWETNTRHWSTDAPGFNVTEGAD